MLTRRVLSLGNGHRVNYPTATGPRVTAVMRGNHKRDTSPELAVRSAVHAAGLRYRVHVPIRLGAKMVVRPDLVFPRQRVAVFVDGCFWHGCPQHGTSPRSNRAYWTAKITRNRERDKQTSRALRRQNWRVVRIWEHETPARAVTRVAAAVRGRSR